MRYDDNESQGRFFDAQLFTERDVNPYNGYLRLSYQVIDQAR